MLRGAGMQNVNDYVKTKKILNLEYFFGDATVHTANEEPVRIQHHCLVPIYVFPEMKLLFPKQNYNVLSPSVPTLIYL
jgi:hypothetical protein